MLWSRRGTLVGWLAVGAIAACGAFGADTGEDKDDTKIAPDAGGGADTGPTGSSSSGQVSSSSGSSGSSSSSSGATCLPPSCPASTFCDPFTRDAPAGLGWLYAGDLPLVSDEFHIARDGGTPCEGALFAYVGRPGVDKTTSRVLSRSVFAQSRIVEVSLDVSLEGDLTFLSGVARGALVVLTTAAKFDGSAPYLAIGMKDREIGLFGRGSTDPPAASATFRALGAGVNKLVARFALEGESSLRINGTPDNGTAFPPISTSSLNLFVGAALANVDPRDGPGFGVHIDNVQVTTP